MSLVSLVVVALVLLLSALGVLAVAMLAMDFAEDAEEMALRLDQESAHGALLGSVESEKHRLISGAMKADREAALKRIGGDA
jgi:hypothetical protein